MSKNTLLIKMIVLFVVVILLFSCGKKEESMPEKITAAHILIMYRGSERAPEEITITKEAAYEQAKKILERIKAGEDFAELAKQYSDGPSGEKGGNLGEFEKGVMVKEFEDAAFKLKKDQVSDIVETKFGYHIIKRLN